MNRPAYAGPARPTAPGAAARRSPALAGALTFALVLALAGCGHDHVTSPPTAHPYSSIAISGPESLLVDSVAVFNVVVLDSVGQPVANPVLSWSTSSAQIATVTGQGAVRGVGEGDVVIRASGGGATSNAASVAVVLGRGWVDESGGVNTLVNLRGVHFVTPRVGYAVGDLGTILKTTDAGQHWSALMSSSTGYTLESVWFLSLTNGFVVGSAGRILHTLDGGHTWMVVTADTDGGRGLNHVYFQNTGPDAHGWIVGNGGLILRTVNAGNSWVRVPPVTAVDLERVSFPRAAPGAPLVADPNAYGWAVGAGGSPCWR